MAEPQRIILGSAVTLLTGKKCLPFSIASSSSLLYLSLLFLDLVSFSRLFIFSFSFPLLFLFLLPFSTFFSPCSNWRKKIGLWRSFKRYKMWNMTSSVDDVRQVMLVSTSSVLLHCSVIVESWQEKPAVLL